LIREFSAGGVVVRRFHGRPFMAAVRLRKGTVLALPKGHIDPGETAPEAARREVREETGVEGDIVERLGDVRYWYSRDGERVAKVVTFFLLEYRRGRLSDHDHEVESAEWVPLEDAGRLLEYKGEREMAEAALSRLTPDR